MANYDVEGLDFSHCEDSAREASSQGSAPRSVVFGLSSSPSAASLLVTPDKSILSSPYFHPSQPGSVHFTVSSDATPESVQFHVSTDDEADEPASSDECEPWVADDFDPFSEHSAHEDDVFDESVRGQFRANAKFNKETKTRKRKYTSAIRMPRSKNNSTPKTGHNRIQRDAKKVCCSKQHIDGSPAARKKILQHRYWFQTLTRQQKNVEGRQIMASGRNISLTNRKEIVYTVFDMEVCAAAVRNLLGVSTYSWHSWQEQVATGREYLNRNAAGAYARNSTVDSRERVTNYLHYIRLMYGEHIPNSDQYDLPSTFSKTEAYRMFVQQLPEHVSVSKSHFMKVWMVRVIHSYTADMRCLQFHFLTNSCLVFTDGFRQSQNSLNLQVLQVRLLLQD